MNSSLRSYAWRRGLRIFPGLVCALVLTAFALAPWAAHWEGSTWSASEAARYIAQNLAMYNAPFGIGTTLDSVPLRFAWNGSLWTLLYELLAYAAVGLLLTPRLVRRHARLVVGILLLGTTLVGPWVNTNVDFNLYRHAVHLGTFFLAGAFLQTLGSHLRLSATGGIVSLALVAVLGITQPSGAAWVALPLSYALLWLGGALPHLFTTNDVSYGLYIYAFPIQQTLTLLTHNLNPYALMFAALIPTTALATLSWHTVEKPALRLKRYVR